MLFSLMGLTGCLGYPDDITPVKGFDVNRYLGTWYEIARLDHSFERGLTKVTADYSLRDDGGLQVINRGYSEVNKEWQEAAGKAYFVRGKDEAYLKVSFFGPFYASYVVFELDEEYQFAFVTSSSTSYLWLLARTPRISEDLLQQFLSRAGQLGYPVDDLIFVEHD